MGVTKHMIYMLKPMMLGACGGKWTNDSGLNKCIIYNNKGSRGIWEDGGGLKI